MTIQHVGALPHDSPMPHATQRSVAPVLGKLKPASALPAPTEEIYAIARTILASVPSVTNLHVGGPLSTPATFNQGYDFGARSRLSCVRRAAD